ncbi:MAG: HlyD family type I secretion periplasmic adaptor subunit [Desulfacinum sp.]|jgi:HlyD family type I secretion membrane fusion protein|nr:HlyD family type I secretion periplasmic adaptor subunit [Desulfacinum sp.]
MIDTNPKRYIILGLVVIFLFFGGLLAWAAFLPFYGAVIAPGTATVVGNKKVVQHLEGGIVDKVLVKDGDKVEAGQLLIRLKSEKIVAQIDLLEGELFFKLAEQARLKAETTLQNALAWPPELLERQDNEKVAAVLREEEAIFQSRRKDLLNKVELYESQIVQLEKQKLGLQAQIEAQDRIRAALRDELAAKETLLEKKYIDKPHILELRRRLAEVEGQRESLRQSIAQVEQKIQELKLRILDLNDAYKAEALAQLRKVTDEIFSLREQLRPLWDARTRLDITAPIAGTIINLAVHSEDSRVIKPGEALMEIVPDNSQLVVEAHIRPNEITKVYVGQTARVQLSAFDRRSVPPVPGTVTYVSADQLRAQTAQGVYSYYVAHVRVDERELEKAGAYLYPGMPAVCYLTTKKRTILDYMLEPLLTVTDQALRES